MVEILKYGTKMQIDCQNCRAVLKYDLKDMYEGKTNISQKVKKRYIICPQCREKVIIEVCR
jgi:Zn finger protein HypA/HybF involved in hydrogenase expression